MTTQTPQTQGSGADWPAIGLVANREITTRLRSKTWRITTLVMALIIIALCVVLKLISGNGTTGYNVGFLPQNQTLGAPLSQLATSLGDKVTPHTVTDQTTGVAEVRSGTLDALVTNADPAHFTVIVNKSIDDSLRNLLSVAASQLALNQQIINLHGNPTAVRQAQAAATVHVQPLQAPYPYQSQQLVLGLITGVLIYISLMINGQIVAQGVVEEKTSRVVELLLSTVRPWQLMAGKVAGVGIVGLIQMLIIGGVGIIAGLSTKVLDISVSAAVGTVVWLVVWYLLGFFMYAIVFAGLGALVSRQEEVAGSTMPALIFVIAGYVLGITILPTDPSSKLIEVLSIIPVFAPTMMPMRLAMGGVPAWEAIVSVLIVLAIIPGLIWFTGRIYRNAVLRTGARVKLSTALRPA